MTTPAPIDPAALQPVVAPFGSSQTLPAAAYLSDEVFAWEQQLLRSTWVCLGRSGALIGVGQARAVEVGGESILLTRDGTGRLRGFSNVCRHRGHELAPTGPAFDARLIRCPYHSWTYGFDGALKAAPTLTQSTSFSLDDYPLQPIAVDEWGGFAFANVSGTARPLTEHIGNLADQLADHEIDRTVRMATAEYRVAANWKTIVENYNECYHCSSIHPELCAVTPPESGIDVQPTGMWCGGTMDLRDGVETMALDGRSPVPPFRRLTGPQLRSVFYATLFPTLMVAAHPDYVLVHRLTPIAATETMVSCEWLFAPETAARSGFDPSYAVEFWDITNKEDWEACESVARGVANRGFTPGPLSSWEATVYQWLAMITHAYLGEGLVVPTAPCRVEAEED